MTLDNLVIAVKALYPSALRVKDYTTAGSDDAVTIMTWNNALGPQPTVDQLTAAITASLLSGAKRQQLGVLSDAYNLASTGPVTYMGSSFAADPSSQQIFGQALTVYKAVGSVPDGFFTADAAGNKVAMTLDQLQGLCVAIADQVLAAFQRWFAVRQALAAATTLAEVQAVVW